MGTIAITEKQGLEEELTEARDKSARLRDDAAALRSQRDALMSEISIMEGQVDIALRKNESKAAKALQTQISDATLGLRGVTLRLRDAETALESAEAVRRPLEAKFADITRQEEIRSERQSTLDAIESAQLAYKQLTESCAEFERKLIELKTRPYLDDGNKSLGYNAAFSLAGKVKGLNV